MKLPFTRKRKVDRLGYWKDKAVILTGASAGLGLELGKALLRQGATLAAVARNAERLREAYCEFPAAHCFPADVTRDGDMEQVTAAAMERFRRIDAVIACAGKSDRGRVEDLTAQRAAQWLDLNFLGAVRSVQPALEHLLKSRGHVVLIGSLASKTASPYLGAYPASKFPLAAYAQQLRLELGGRGLHTLLVCPGPLARADAGARYDRQASDLPPEARRPGGGARLSGIDPERLATSVLRACRRRRAELVVPAKARLLFVLQQVWATWGDWLVKKMTTDPHHPATGSLPKN